MRGVEAASVGILALYLFLQYRRGSLASFAREAASIALAGYLAEDLCIRLFEFYGYNPGWTLTLDRMPALVALIWPFVILSARDVARALKPTGSTALLGAAIVLYDAALIEPVAVRAGLWSWSEHCLWGVPLIGVWGWSLFAFLALALLERGRVAWVPLVAPPLANAGLVVGWWCGFRWGPRAELPLAVEVGASVVAAAVLLGALRKHRGAATMAVMGPRAVAASLFFVLVAVHGDLGLWGYLLPFAVPYLWLCRWSSARRDAAPARLSELSG